MTQNILYMASRANIAGGEVYLLDVFRHLDRSRFHPIVAVPKEGQFSEKLRELGIDCVISAVDYGWLKPPMPWYRFLGSLQSRVRQLGDVLQKNQIALVHTNSNMILEGALAARLSGLPHVHVVHIPFQEDLPVYRRVPLAPASFAQLIGELSARVVAVAEPVAMSISPPIPREKIRVIHNGLDLDAYANARAKANGSFRREIGIPANEMLIAAIGRIHPDKGFEYFVEAASIVHRAVPDAHFIIAGAGDSPVYEKQLRMQIKDTGLSGTVHLVGFRDDIPRILAETDIFVLTSRSEGGPYVLLEAMACGCACIASRCGGFVEYIIRDGETGWLVDYGDAKTAAQYVLDLISDRSQRARLGDAGMAVAFSAEFDVRHSVQRLISVYDEVLEEPKQLPGSFGVDLLLQAASEISYLGTRLTELEERIKRPERAANLLLDNPVVRALRKLRSR